MATVLFNGVFDQILLKTAKNVRFRHTFSTLRLSLPCILRTIGFFLVSAYFLFIELGLAKIWLVLVHSSARFKLFFGGVAGSEDFACATFPTTPP